MQVTHAGYARWRRQFEADANAHSAKFYRLMNEVPTLLMIGIVILVIVKPF
jgi:putative membrane protein